MKKLISVLIILAIFIGSGVLIFGQNVIYDNDFREWLKVVENISKKGWNSSTERWYVISSPDPGCEIAWGIKVDCDDYSYGITEDEAESLFTKAIKRAYNSGDNYFSDRFDISLDDMFQPFQEVVIDFSYNLGSPKSFPKFMEALYKFDYILHVQNGYYSDTKGWNNQQTLNKIKETLKEEYKRYWTDRGRKRELGNRNDTFYYRFLSSLYY